jgi:hypothetical protein
VDARLRGLLKAAQADPAQLPRAVATLIRAGDPAAAVGLIYRALERGAGEPAVDGLSPASIEDLQPTVLEPRGTGHLKAAVWWPDERGLYVVDEGPRAWTARAWIRSWPLDGAPEELLDSAALPDPGRSQGYLELRGLTLDAAGARLAFTSVGVPPTGGGGCRWQVIDLATGSVRRGPLADGITECWAGDELSGLSLDRRRLLTWRPGRVARTRVLVDSVEVVAAPGTSISRYARKLTFRQPGGGEPIGEATYPAAVRRSWSGLTACWGGRALCCDRAGRLLTLVSAAGALGQAPLPESPPRNKLVGVFPCPSGWVVALRYKQKRVVDLVDLRSGQARRVSLPHTPRHLAWSPTGRSLALPSQRGVMQLLVG